MELDDAYANAPYIPGAEKFPARWADDAASFRARASMDGRARLDLPYGTGPREVLDLFLPDGTPQGLAVFVHGGYWLRFDKSSWSHLAQGPLAHGWAVALPSYDLAPKARIPQITAQITRAIESAAQEIAGPIRLAGHSAGGHLVARMRDPRLLPPQTASRLARILPISPVSDLRPLLRTSMNRDLKLDAQSATAESPVLMHDLLPVPTTVWVGAKERPAFLDQARWLAEAWAADHTVEKDRHHFDVIDSLAAPEGALTKALLA
ncbi:alpha/beta hydrolase fold [Poseidonocella pacifica]|uniref:Alpha/beta hydrolase fold n=1 Tax=Poseidonocella pacifica TaxID=871651 RepID=A0A1I0XSW9_9RHOB|nr:alpha/beta hydrolase [Poseidonocella pacifica]SFB04102.1 alpha/beta hydrolase fold [Poseidonocella pacifica]